ncbi:MAG: DNA helicase [Planctomycetaceae bacterium]|nr:DNA helicase [Planctomycetaceae bacterium]
MTDAGTRAETCTQPEDLFACLFCEVFGLEKAQLLVPQHPVADIEGTTRYIDFALRTVAERIAFEIDGLTWHVPDPARVRDYEDALLRQNSLVHFGWRVFRWTDRQIADEPARVKDQLALFLERIPGLLEFDDFLPKQRGELLELRDHQEDALNALNTLRAEGNTIALLQHATGTGKTVTAITDARRLGLRTLFVVHTKDLVEQAVGKFAEFWPEVTCGRFADAARDTAQPVIVGTVQSLSKNLTEFAPNDFGYLIVDEAHHATAESYQQLLGYFKPRFTLGLTATPDRADGQSALEVFRTAAHRLGLREAVECGELVPIRCVRVETNVDLTRVRFNAVQYHRKDIEEAVLVPDRDRLIVDTYAEHVSGRRAVVFCVNVDHGERLAKLFNDRGHATRSVSGRMSTSERREALDQFVAGTTRVLCACDLLNEGWDCPGVEVLFMARPTLSKVIYLQQLGRGTRKAPGKESLLVFDFVDNATHYNASLSLHRLLGVNQYRKGGLMLGNSDALKTDVQALASNATPPTLPVSLWAKEYCEIDVFNWQDAVKGLVSASALEDELGATEGRIRDAARRGDLVADHVLPLGERTYYYFRPERAEQIRTQLNLPRLDDETVRELFLAFVNKMDMSASYKPVMLRALLELADEDGRVRVDDAARAFHKFYSDRRRTSLVVEKASARMNDPHMTTEAVRQLMLDMPFRKFEQKKFLKYDRDVAFARFSPALWRQLDADDRVAIRAVCEAKIAEYYARLS